MPSSKPTISEEQWNSLSLEEKELLRRLKLTPRVKKTRILTEKPFVLGIYIKCKLCETEHCVKWKMIPSLKENILYYQGKKFSDGSRILEDKREERKQATCCHCKRVLLESKSKEELTCLLIKETAKSARRKEMKL